MVFVDIVCVVCGNVLRLETRRGGFPDTCGAAPCLKAIQIARYRAIKIERALARAALANAQPLRAHHSARSWTLIGPDGSLYRFDNLRRFIREHQHLFPPKYRDDGGQGSARLSTYLCRLRPRRSKVAQKHWHGWRWYDADGLNASLLAQRQARKDELVETDTHIGAMLRLLRTRRGLSAAEVGKTIGVSAQQIFKLEAGDDAMKSVQLYALAAMFEVPVDYFFFGLSERDLPGGLEWSYWRKAVMTLLNAPDGAKMACAFSSLSLQDRRTALAFLTGLAKPESAGTALRKISSGD